ncbi:hypothetical protein QT381_07725 [Galbitalea sp. SE-J8]|uniref:hypothetical protein n=1 Tax=Galbitalea sp. SE-J8 TaxID=3054952 RepID=UPI00259D0D96|nr:hypothetical protein [Galbitalea sp. SE-J8]MDM4762893.1 hypothetical protein [Galbitalea sp. SE-J8]
MRLPTFVAMRVGWTASAAIVLALILAACSDGARPPVETSASHASTPAAVSADEAQAVFAQYLIASDSVAVAERGDASPVKPYVTPRMLVVEQRAATAFKEAGVHQDGATTFDGFTVQRSDQSEMVAYLCLDGSETHLTDADGHSAVKEGTPDRQSVVVTFVRQGTQLRVDGLNLWSGQSVC